MHGVAEAGSVRASQWLRREHAAYMAVGLCLRTSLMYSEYDVYDCIESTEMVE